MGKKVFSLFSRNKPANPTEAVNTPVTIERPVLPTLGFENLTGGLDWSDNFEKSSFEVQILPASVNVTAKEPVLVSDAGKVLDLKPARTVQHGNENDEYPAREITRVSVTQPQPENERSTYFNSDAPMLDLSWIRLLDRYVNEPQTTTRIEAEPSLVIEAAPPDAPSQKKELSKIPAGTQSDIISPDTTSDAHRTEKTNAAMDLEERKNDLLRHSRDSGKSMSRSSKEVHPAWRNAGAVISDVQEEVCSTQRHVPPQYPAPKATTPQGPFIAPTRTLAATPQQIDHVPVSNEESKTAEVQPIELQQKNDNPGTVPVRELGSEHRVSDEKAYGEHDNTVALPLNVSTEKRVLQPANNEDFPAATPTLSLNAPTPGSLSMNTIAVTRPTENFVLRPRDHELETTVSTNTTVSNPHTPRTTVEDRIEGHHELNTPEAYASECFREPAVASGVSIIYDEVSNADATIDGMSEKHHGMLWRSTRRGPGEVLSKDNSRRRLSMTDNGTIRTGLQFAQPSAGTLRRCKSENGSITACQSMVHLPATLGIVNGSSEAGNTSPGFLTRKTTLAKLRADNDPHTLHPSWRLARASKIAKWIDGVQGSTDNYSTGHREARVFDERVNSTVKPFLEHDRTGMSLQRFHSQSAHPRRQPSVNMRGQPLDGHVFLPHVSARPSNSQFRHNYQPMRSPMQYPPMYANQFVPRQYHALPRQHLGMMVNGRPGLQNSAEIVFRRPSGSSVDRIETGQRNQFEPYNNGGRRDSPVSSEFPSPTWNARTSPITTKSTMEPMNEIHDDDQTKPQPLQQSQNSNLNEHGVQYISNQASIRQPQTPPAWPPKTAAQPEMTPPYWETPRPQVPSTPMARLPETPPTSPISALVRQTASRLSVDTQEHTPLSARQAFVTRDLYQPTPTHSQYPTRTPSVRHPTTTTNYAALAAAAAVAGVRAPIPATPPHTQSHWRAAWSPLKLGASDMRR